MLWFKKPFLFVLIPPRGLPRCSANWRGSAQCWRARGKCPQITNTQPCPVTFSKGTERTLHHVPPRAPEPALLLRQRGVLVPGRPRRWGWKACGCSYLEVPGPALRFRQGECIQECFQTWHAPKRLNEIMPRVELSEIWKQLRRGPNEIGFACAKTTNYQMKCQRLCMW